MKRWKKLRRKLRARFGRPERVSAGSALQLERFAQAPAAEPTRFGYRLPPKSAAVKQVVRLAGTEIMRGAVQVLRSGGEESLHFHEGQDGFWMVLRGRARFFGPDDALLGEFGQHEGILIPRGCAYRYEAVGADALEMLQLLAFDRRGRVARRNLEPRTLDARSVEKFDARYVGDSAQPD